MTPKEQANFDLAKQRQAACTHQTFRASFNIWLCPLCGYQNDYWHCLYAFTPNPHFTGIDTYGRLWQEGREVRDAAGNYVYGKSTLDDGVWVYGPADPR